MKLQYFIHNGYLGCSYGTAANPQLITEADAARLMQVAGISQAQAESMLPPAQYADEGDPLYELTGGNRFIVYTSPEEMADVRQEKVSRPLHIDWRHYGHPGTQATLSTRPMSADTISAEVFRTPLRNLETCYSTSTASRIAAVLIYGVEQ